MNDDVERDMSVPSGNRGESTDSAPLLPPEPEPARTTSSEPRRYAASLRNRRRSWLAGAAALVLAAGLGGFTLGHAAGAGGPDGPGDQGGSAVFQQDDHHGFPGDRSSDDDGGGVPPQQQSPGSDAEGSNT